MKPKYEIAALSDSLVTVDVTRLAESDELFFNATQMAKAFGRRPDDFWKQAQNREYLEVLITLSEGNCTDADFIVTRRGRYHGGTYFHKDLALQFARWLSPEFAIRLDKWVHERIDQEHEWQRDRLESKTGFLPLTKAIQQAHDEPKFYHFTNECDMINRIVLGLSSKEFKLKHRVENVRDALNPEQLASVAQLQFINAGLLLVGMGYEERKQHLAKHHHQHRGAIEWTN